MLLLNFPRKSFLRKIWQFTQQFTQFTQFTLDLTSGIFRNFYDDSARQVDKINKFDLGEVSKSFVENSVLAF